MNKVKEILERYKEIYKKKHGKEWKSDDSDFYIEYKRLMDKAMTVELDFSKDLDKVSDGK